MIELIKAMLWSQQSFVGMLMGAIPAVLVYKDNPPKTGWDYFTIGLIVLMAAIRQSAVLNAPGIVTASNERKRIAKEEKDAAGEVPEGPGSDQ